MTQPPRTASDRISVLVVTADNITAELLTNAFSHERSRNFAVQALIGSSQRVIGKLPEHQPDVALVCDQLQDSLIAGFSVLQKLRKSHQGTAAVMLLQSFNPESVVEAFREGARGVFSRAHSLKALSKCIRAVHDGQYWASNEDLEHVMGALGRHKSFRLADSEGVPLLTRREEEVVRLVAEGLRNEEVAQRLDLAEHSVRNYISRIFDKLNVSSRVELILYVRDQQDRRN